MIRVLLAAAREGESDLRLSETGSIDENRPQMGVDSLFVWRWKASAKSFTLACVGFPLHSSFTNLVREIMRRVFFFLAG